MHLPKCTPYTDTCFDKVLHKLARTLEQSLLAKLEKYSMEKAIYACHRSKEVLDELDGFTECACLPKTVYALVEAIFNKHMTKWLGDNGDLLKSWQSDPEAHIPAMETELCKHVLHDLFKPGALAAPPLDVLEAVCLDKSRKEAAVARRLMDAFKQGLGQATTELNNDKILESLPAGVVIREIQRMMSGRSIGAVPDLSSMQEEQLVSSEANHSSVLATEPESKKKAAKGGRAKALLRGSAPTPGGLPPQSSRDPLQPRASHGCTLLPRPRAAPPRASDGALPRAFAGLTLSRLSGGAPHVPGMIRQPRCSNSGASQRASATTLALHRTGAAGGQVAVLHAF